MTLSLEDVIPQLRAIQTPEALWDIARQFFRERGAQIISYRHVIGELSADHAPTLTYDGVDEQIVDQIVASEVFRENPIAVTALKSTEPFFWRDVQKLAQLTPEERGYLEMIEALVPGEGLVIQVFGPQCRNGTVNLGFGHEPPPLDHQTQRELQVFAQLGHMQYCRLVPLQPDDDVLLSGREREVLDWIARGKSNSVIADILGISSHTVDTHVRRIFRKLDVNDRTTAAVKGLGSGLLQVAS